MATNVLRGGRVQRGFTANGVGGTCMNLALRSQLLAVPLSFVPKAAFHTAEGVYQRSQVESNARDRPHGKLKSLERDLPVEEKLAELERLVQLSERKLYQTLNVDHIAAPHTGNIRVLSLNRPKARNAISRQLLQDLKEQIENIHEETHAGQTRALVLASDVDGAFCAGADLVERKNMSQAETKHFLSDLRYTFGRISSLPIPTIACVGGYALGGGLELALCADLRVFSWNAKVGLPETSLGIIPGAGGTYRLPQVIGLSKARELVLTARRLTGSEALNIGLCNYCVTADDASVDSEQSTARKLTLLRGIKLAEEISRNGPIAVRAAIRAMKNGESEEAENAAYDTTLHSKDRLEALKAFAEKRSPAFTGE